MRNYLLIVIVGMLLVLPCAARAQSDSIPFSAAIPLAGSSHSWAILSADFDGNGLPDIIAGDKLDGGFYLFTDTGNGYFATTVHTDGPQAYSMAAADFDSSGSIDLAVASFGDITIFLNDGSGNFTQGDTYPLDTAQKAGAAPYHALAVDLNKDGKPDLMTVNYNLGKVSVFINKGSGQFESASMYAVGSGPHCITATDFDKDGNIDLATSDFYGPTVSILRGKGDGTFYPRTYFSATSNPTCVAAADFDRDGYQDVVVGIFGSFNTVDIYKNDSLGHFRKIQEFTVDAQPRFFLIDDFDGDHLVDIAVTCMSNSILCVLKGKGDGTFSAAAKYQAGNWLAGICGGDFDHNGLPDLATANYSGDINLFMNLIPPAAVDDPSGQNALPIAYRLDQNHPNPFNPATTISYTLPRQSHVTVAVYNILGQQVKVLGDIDQAAGSYTISWDGRDDAGDAVASGIYLYRITADNFSETKKMILMK